MIRSWSKWGGARTRSLYAVEFKYTSWYCQECGEEQAIELPGYLVPLDNEGSDYIKVCALCKNKMVVNQFLTGFELLAVLKD